MAAWRLPRARGVFACWATLPSSESITEVAAGNADPSEALPLLTVRGGKHGQDRRTRWAAYRHQRSQAPESGQVVVARFGDEVALKRYVRLDERHVELRSEIHNPEHRVMQIDIAKAPDRDRRRGRRSNDHEAARDRARKTDVSGRLQGCKLFLNLNLLVLRPALLRLLCTGAPRQTSVGVARP